MTRTLPPHSGIVALTDRRVTLTDHGWNLLEELLGWLAMALLVAAGVGGTLAYQWMTAMIGAWFG